MLKLLFSLETKERLRHTKFENRQVRVKFQLLKEYSSTIRSFLFFFYPQWIILGEKKKATKEMFAEFRGNRHE